LTVVTVASADAATRMGFVVVVVLRTDSAGSREPRVYVARAVGAVRLATVVVVRAETSGAEFDALASDDGASGEAARDATGTPFDSGLIDARVSFDSLAGAGAAAATGATGVAAAAGDGVAGGSVAAIVAGEGAGGALATATVVALATFRARRAASRNMSAASAASSGTSCATTASGRVAPTHTRSFGSLADAASISSTRSPLPNTTRGLSSSRPRGVASLVIEAGRALVDSASWSSTVAQRSASLALTVTGWTNALR
jgi:hypothetical protein